MNLKILLQKSTDLEARVLELERELDRAKIELDTDLNYQGAMADCKNYEKIIDEQAAHIKRVKSAIVDFKMASLKDIHERLSTLYDIASETSKQSLSHRDAGVVELLHIKLIAEFIEHPDNFTEIFDFIGRYAEQLKN